MLIYEFALPVDRSTVVVCLWPTPGPTSFISNILTSTQHVDPSPHFMDMSLFTVNKLVHAEASYLFYKNHVFRFSSSQLGTLLMVPAVLNKLRRMEIEDVLPHQRRWNFESMLDKLHALPLLDEVVIGVVASGNCAQTLLEIEGRPYHRWQSKDDQLSQLFWTYLDADDIDELCRVQEECRKWEEHCPLAMIEQKKDWFTDMWGIQSGFNFAPLAEKPIPPHKFSYQMTELPKVTYLNFELRAEWRKAQALATTSSW